MGRKENANFCGVALRKSSLFCPHDENENKLWKILTSNDKGFQELSGQDETGRWSKEVNGSKNFHFEVGIRHAAGICESYK